MSLFDYSAHVKDYHQCRKRLTNQIVPRIMDSMSRREIMLAAKKLTMVHKNTIMLGCEAESDVLTEFALFSHLHAFGSVALRWCKRQKVSSNSLDGRIFTGLQTSMYSVFRVVDIFPHKGLLLQDIYTEKEFPVMDIGISTTAKIDMLLASRIVSILDWHMFTGAVIPLLDQTYHALKPYLQKNARPEMIGQDRPFSAKKEAAFQVTIIRKAIANDAFESIAYEKI